MEKYREFLDSSSLVKYDWQIVTLAICLRRNLRVNTNKLRIDYRYLKRRFYTSRKQINKWLKILEQEAYIDLKRMLVNTNLMYRGQPSIVSKLNDF